MSGFLQPVRQEELCAALHARDASLSAAFFIENDTLGSIYTAAGAAGGMVIISGTGSMSQLLDASGETHNCGGWGHLIGDGAAGLGCGDLTACLAT